MKILKITDGFVTNSSSQSMTVILAKLKGKDLGDLFEKLRISRHFASNFYVDVHEIEEIDYEDYLENIIENIEFDDLTDEYHILICHYLISSWQDDIHFDNTKQDDVYIKFKVEENGLNKDRRHFLGDDLILLYTYNGC